MIQWTVYLPFGAIQFKMICHKYTYLKRNAVLFLTQICTFRCSMSAEKFQALLRVSTDTLKDH